jgi:predicted ArsR family transcriptional regulator
MCRIIFLHTDPNDNLLDIKIEPDEGEMELQNALNKVRKLRQSKGVKPTSRIENVTSHNCPIPVIIT